MWRCGSVVVAVLVLEIISSHPLSSETKYECARKLGLDCCPCPASTDLEDLGSSPSTIQNKKLSLNPQNTLGKDAESSDFNPATSGIEDEASSSSELDSVPAASSPGAVSRGEGLDDCSCPCRGSDSEGSPSNFLPRALHSLRPMLTPSSSKEDPKPLLQPEVDLASSVLGTLKEATEEEYKDAVARDAARSAARASEAQLGDSADETGKIVTIIMNPREDEDALIQEASSVHETRCTHPLGATHSSSVQSPHKELFFRSDMDSGASNVNEQVIGNTGLENIKLKSVKSKSALPRFESLGFQPLRVRDSLNLLNFNKNKHITDNNKHSSIFKPSSFRPLPKFKTLGRAEISRNSQKEISDMDNGPLPSNIEEQFLEVEPKMSRPNLKLSVPIREWKSPLKLKDLWKLKEVELIPPRLSNVKINIPTLELPPIKRQRVVGKCTERDEIPQGDTMKTKILDIVPSASQKNQESDVSTNTEILDSVPNMPGNIPTAQDDSMEKGLQSINEDTKSLNNDVETSETQTSIIESIPIEGVNLLKSGSSNTESIVIENGAPNRVVIIENGKANQFTSDDYVNAVEPINFNLPEEAINLEDTLYIGADDEIEISDFDALGDTDVDASNIVINPQLVEMDYDNEDLFRDTEPIHLLRDTDVDASNIAINPQLVEMDYDNEDILRDTEPTEVNNATSSETEPSSIDKLNKLLNTQHYMRINSKEDFSRETVSTEANNTMNSETEPSSFDKLSKLLNSQHYVRSSDNAPQLVDNEDIVRETEATDANNSTNPETETTSYDKVSKLLNTEHIMRSNDHESDETTSDEVLVRNSPIKPNTDVSYGDLQQLSDSLLHKSNHKMRNDQRSLENEEGESAEDDNDQIEADDSENITSDSSNTDMQNMDTTDLEQVVITALGAGDQDESQDNQSNSLESIDDTTINNNESRNVEEKSCLSDFSTAQDISRPDIPKENNEMMVEASAPMASVISHPILRASPFEGIVEPLPLIGNNLFNNPLPNILNFNTELPTLDNVRSGIENILGLNSEKAADNADTDDASSEFVLADDCSDADPTMATDASTTKSKSVLPSLSPKEALNLDIFQIRPLALSKIPGIDLKSLKTTFANPKTLDLRPVKLQSSLGRNGRVLGATLTFGPDKLGSSSPRLSSQTVTKPLANMPSVDDFRDTLRAHTENLIKSSPLSSPSIPTLRSSSTLEDIHDNLRLQTKKSMRNIQKTLASTFNEAKTAQEKYAKPQDMLEDMNDKLEALHMDFNDRLTSIHERIFDQRNEPLVLPSMTKESKHNSRPVKKLSIPSTDFRGSQIKSNVNIKPYRMSKAATSLVPKSVDVPKLYTTSMKPPFSVPLKRDHNLKLKEVKPITELIRNDNSHGLRKFKPIVHDTNKHSLFTHGEPLTRGFKPKATPKPRIRVEKRPPTPKFIHGHHNVNSHRKHFGDTKGFASEVKPLRVLPPTNPTPLNYGISRKLTPNFNSPAMRSSQGRIPQNTGSAVETKPKAPLTKQSRPSSSSSQIAPDPKPLTEGAASEVNPTSRRVMTHSLPWPTLSNSDLLKRVREKSALNLPTISLQGRISQNAGSAVETKPKAPLTKQSRPSSSTSQIAPDPKPVIEGLASDIQPTLRKAFPQPISRISSRGRISQNIGSAVETKPKAPLTKQSRPSSSTSQIAPDPKPVIEGLASDIQPTLRKAFPQPISRISSRGRISQNIGSAVETKPKAPLTKQSRPSSSTSQIAPNPKPLTEGCESIVNPTSSRVMTQGLWPRLSDSALLERVRGKSLNHPTLSLQGRISQNAGTAVESKPKAPLTKQSRPSSIDPKPLTEGSASDIKSTSRKAMSPMSIISSQGRISQNAGTAVESKPKAPLTKQSRPSSIDPKPLTEGSTSDIKSSSRKAISQSLPWPKPTDNAFLERVREALKSRISSINNPMKSLNNVKQTSNDNDMAKAASEYNEVVVLKDESMKENVSYRCKMVCVKEPVV